MDTTRKQKLQAFVDWSRSHITGDEKGQAQIYLDRLFQAFGQKGSLDVGGSPEMRIKKSDEDGGGTAFADYVWKPVVLIEMKKRGVDLKRHYAQAFEYWKRVAPPGRPQYVILCNFDEFHVYDILDGQIDTPKDVVTLAELPDRWGPLAFLFPTNEKPVFGNDRIAVTRDAADALARCFNLLTFEKRTPAPIERELAQRFILQSLVALFAEDIDLLPKYSYVNLLDQCKTPTDSYDLIGGLFEAMNRKEGNAGGRYKGVRYFNGALFANPARVELDEKEVVQLKDAAKSDWSKVSPEIFGTLFEHSLGKEDRHAYGAHFTSPIDIMKIVKPTIIEPWQDAIESARSAKSLEKLLERLTTLRVLDPACGSGNFLYLAYRAMRRLEARIRERLTNEFPGTQPKLLHVSARQFFGLDINQFAVELAKVSIMLGRKLAIDELHIGDEPPLPLDNLNENFRCVDALIATATPPSPHEGEGRGEGYDADASERVESQSSGIGVPVTTASHPSPNPSLKGRGTRGVPAIQTPWPPADVIIGNPPFLGAKRLKPERGADYVNAVRKLYHDIPGMADYCVYWIKRSHDHIPTCTKTDPLAGRAGLVGTQNIRNNQSRVGGLDHVVRDGTIIDAVDNQPWSGEAAVHVSIVNWIKSQDTAVVPKVKRLWSKVTPARGGKRQAVKGQRADKIFELEDRPCDAISSALSDGTHTAIAKRLKCNYEPQVCFNGQFPRCKEFEIEPGEAHCVLSAAAKNREVVFPCMIGREFLTHGKALRFVIDFQKRDIVQSQRYGEPFAIVQERVLPYVQKYADAERKKTGKEKGQDHGWLQSWWQHFRCRKEMVDLIEAKARYLVCSDTTKRPVFDFVLPRIRPDHKLRVFAFDDDYSFGILQSHSHWLWFVTNCSKLKSDFNYTSTTVFDTFPWPQSPTKKQVDAVAAAGREVRKVREQALKVIDGGLRAVYRTLELPGKHPLKDAHAALDAAVLDAYGLSAKKDLLKQLLDVNHEVAKREKAGEAVTAPGVPPSYGDPKKLITDDCIKPG